MNVVTKVFFTCFTYTFYLANIISSECLELVNFPWFLLYILFTRITVISEATTFLCMSLAKVILNWRLDIYVKLNSDLTINIATLCVLVLLAIDNVIRIDMHVLGNCSDQMAFEGYQVEFQREFCMPEISNSTENLTLCEIYNQAENVYPIGCNTCPSYPTMRILFGAILLLELIKFLLGFYRIMKKYGKKIQDMRHNKVNTTNKVTKHDESLNDQSTTKSSNVSDNLQSNSTVMTNVVFKEEIKVKPQKASNENVDNMVTQNNMNEPQPGTSVNKSNSGPISDEIEVIREEIQGGNNVTTEQNKEVIANKKQRNR